MKRTLTLISTGLGIVEGLVATVREFGPGVTVRNIVDDDVISDIRANNNVVPAGVVRRIASYCRIAEEAGSDAALITCSSISETVDMVRPFVDIPVFKIDEPMAEVAINRAETSVGIAATLMTTLRPTRALVESKASDAGKKLHFEEELCEGAFEALGRGEGETHDEIVLEGVKRLLQECDVVVLAQASMARVADRLERAEDKERVLTSPQLGISRVLDTLD